MVSASGGNKRYSSGGMHTEFFLNKCACGKVRGGNEKAVLKDGDFFSAFISTDHDNNVPTKVISETYRHTVTNKCTTATNKLSEDQIMNSYTIRL